MNSHETVSHCWRGTIIDSVLPSCGKEIPFFDLVRPDPFGNTYHPEELVNVVAGIAQQSPEYDQNVVDIMLSQYWVADLLPRAHRLSHRGNVSVVPGIVVNKCWSIGHTTNLIAIIPPGHDLSILRRVLSKPVVCFTVIVDDMLAAVRQPTGEDNRGR